MKKITLLIVVCGFITHTIANIQTDTLPQEQLVNLLVDLELAQAMIYRNGSISQEQADSLFEEQAQHIFEAYAINIDMLQRSCLAYLADPKSFQDLYDQVIGKLEKLLDES